MAHADEPTSASPAAPRPRWPALLAAGLALLLCGEVSALLWQHARAVPQTDWREAARRLAAQREARREPVLFAPRWTDPLGRRYVGAALDLRLATLPHIDSFARVWEIAARGAQHPWLAGRSPARRVAVGALELRLYQQQPVDVLYDFFDGLQTAEVDLVGTERTVCPPGQQRAVGGQLGPRFNCDPSRGWSWVGWQLAEIDFQPHRCIYAHPVEDRRLRIRFSAVPLGQKLVLFTGIHDFISRRQGEAPVLLQVFVDGDLVGGVNHQNRWGWQRTAFDTGARAGRTAEVRFEVTSPLAYARTFCFTGETRR